MEKSDIHIARNIHIAGDIHITKNSKVTCGNKRPAILTLSCPALLPMSSTCMNSLSDDPFDQADLIVPYFLLVSGEKDGQMNKVKRAVLDQDGVAGGSRQNGRPAFDPGGSVPDKSNPVPVDLFNPGNNVALRLMAIVFEVFGKLEFFPDLLNLRIHDCRQGRRTRRNLNGLGC